MASNWADGLAELGYWLQILSKTHTYGMFVSAFQLLSELWLWFLGGLAITSVLATFISLEKLAKAMQRKRTFGVVVAAALGVVSPLATYAVIPLAVLLLRQGAPLAPLTAFMISSPLVNPATFTITAGGMGFGMAIARVITSLVLAILGGMIAGRLEKKGKGPTGYLRQEEVAAAAELPFHHYRKSMEGLKSGRFARLINGREGARTWFENFKLQVRFAGRFFLFAILVSAAVGELVSPYTVIPVLGGGSWYSVAVAAIAGVPFYTCGGAAIPMMQVLESMGMARGAILAFFVTGPATNVSTLLTLGALFRSEFLALYYGITFGGALLAGYLFQWFGF